MPEPLRIEPKYKKFAVKIDGAQLNLNIREPSFALMNKCKDENDIKRILSEWIFNSIEESQKTLTSVEEIYIQDDYFFNKVFSEFVKDNETFSSYYNKRDESEEICNRFINAYYDYANEITRKSFSKIQKCLGNLINSYKINASSIIKAVNRTAESYKRITEDINKMISSLIETIGKIKIPQISEERKQKLINSYKRWGEYGWTPHPDAPLFYYENCPSNQIDADKYALKFCNNKVEMKSLFENIKSFKVSNKDLDEAIKCFDERCYKACSLLLFSLIEKELIKLQIKDKRGHKLVGEKAVRYLENKVNERYDVESRLFLLLDYNCLIICLFKYFQNGANFTLQTNVINRNLLGHNMEKKTVRRKDCIKLFLLLYNTLFFVKFLEAKI